MIYTNHKLYAALKTIIPNIPEGCSELTLKLSSRLDPPTIEVAIYAHTAIEDDTLKYSAAEKFYVISEKNWAEVKRVMALSPEELVQMS